MKSSQEEVGSLLGVSGKARDRNTRLWQLGGHTLLQSQLFQGNLEAGDGWVGMQHRISWFQTVTPATTAAHKLCWVAQRV